MQSIHKTVLLNETIDGLNLSLDAVIVDGTFGGGGHSALVCKKFPSSRIIALDKDKSAFSKAEDKFKGLTCTLDFNNENFRDLDKVLNSLDIENVDAIILDLGLSSDQLDNSQRGFSFLRDEPLLMTMKENPNEEDLTVKDIVNTWGEENLANIIYGYGGEKFSRRIAKNIVDERQKREINTTFELVKIIEDSVPFFYKKGRIHCATKTFQALRIAVNDELGALSDGLEKGFTYLKEGGRMAVISFHSLEDRIVKNFFKEKEKTGYGRLINKKPIIPSEIEIKENSRSRSAKLRIIEKIK